MATDPKATPHVGYFRQSKRCAWERIAEGGTWGEAWARTLDALATASLRGGESTVLPLGRRPEHTATRQPRRAQQQPTLFR